MGGWAGTALALSPAVMLFKGGQMVDQVVGLADKGVFKKMIDKYLA